MSFNDVSRGGRGHIARKSKRVVHVSHPQMKSLGRQGVDYHAKIGYRLKKEI